MSAKIPQTELLKNAKVNDYELFSLKGLVTYAKLLSNYDGDTGDILFIYNQKPMRLKARFLIYYLYIIKNQ